jgi:hypothetical protein
VYSQTDIQTDERHTQADFVSILIRLLGLENRLPTGAILPDKIELLDELGCTPLHGWQPEQMLTKGDVAVVLGQILKINVPIGAAPEEYVRTLTDRGIMTPGSTEKLLSLPDLATSVNKATAMPGAFPPRPPAWAPVRPPWAPGPPDWSPGPPDWPPGPPPWHKPVSPVDDDDDDDDHDDED